VSAPCTDRSSSELMALANLDGLGEVGIQDRMALLDQLIPELLGKRGAGLELVDDDSFDSKLFAHEDDWERGIAISSDLAALASATVSAVMLTIRLTVALGVRICTGLAAPSRINPMLGFKVFDPAAVTIAGVELLYRIRKGQFNLGRLRRRGQAAPAIWNAVLSA